jgi:steroid delta-isomerase-like uncharacterized protein
MSEKLERVARQMIEEVWNRGNINLIPQLVTNDYVGHDPSNPVRGATEAQQVVTKFRAAFPDCRVGIEETLSAGHNGVLVRWTFSGTQRGQLDTIAPSGRTVNGTGMTLYRFSGDRIKEAFTNWDALGMMQQLGVVTLPGRTSVAGA